MKSTPPLFSARSPLRMLRHKPQSQRASKSAAGSSYLLPTCATSVPLLCHPSRQICHHALLLGVTMSATLRCVLPCAPAAAQDGRVSRCAPSASCLRPATLRSSSAFRPLRRSASACRRHAWALCLRALRSLRSLI